MRCGALTRRRTARLQALGISIVVAVVGVWIFRPPARLSFCRRPSASDLAFLPFTASGEAPGVGGRDFAQMVQLDVEWFRRLRVTPEATVACWADSVSAPLRDARAVRDLGARQVVSGSCCDNQGDGRCESQFGTVSPSRPWC